MRTLIPAVILVCMMGCATSNRDLSSDGVQDAVVGGHVTAYAVSHERLHPFHAKSSEYMAGRKQQEGGSYELQVQVSRLTEQDGRVTETVIARPRLEVWRGVSVVSPYRGLKVPSRFPFASASGGKRGAEEDVSVDVAWEGEQSDVAVCSVTVMLRGEIVSRTEVELVATE